MEFRPRARRREARPAYECPVIGGAAQSVLTAALMAAYEEPEAESSNRWLGSNRCCLPHYLSRFGTPSLSSWRIPPPLGTEPDFP